MSHASAVEAIISFVIPSTFSATASSNSFSLVPLAIWGINEIEVRTAKALPLPISSRISLTPVSACGVPMQNEFKLLLIVVASMFKA